MKIRRVFLGIHGATVALTAANTATRTLFNTDHFLSQHVFQVF
jgi:hypothetical protein